MAISLACFSVTSLAGNDFASRIYLHRVRDSDSRCLGSLAPRSVSEYGSTVSDSTSVSTSPYELKFRKLAENNPTDIMASNP